MRVKVSFDVNEVVDNQDRKVEGNMQALLIVQAFIYGLAGARHEVEEINSEAKLGELEIGGMIEVSLED